MCERKITWTADGQSRKWKWSLQYNTFIFNNSVAGHNIFQQFLQFIWNYKGVLQTGHFDYKVVNQNANFRSKLQSLLQKFSQTTMC